MNKPFKREVRRIAFVLTAAAVVFCAGVFFAYSNSRAICFGDVKNFSQYMGDLRFAVFKVGQTFVPLPI